MPTTITESPAAGPPAWTAWTAWAAVVTVALIGGTLVGGVPLPSAGCVAMVVPAAMADVRSRHLPDRLLALAAGALVLGLSIDAALGSRPDSGSLAAAAVLFAGPLLVLHLVSPCSMGFGDVKAALVLGAALGVADWRLALPALALAAGISSAGSILVRARTIPFGPGLVTGTAIALLAASSLLPSESTASPPRLAIAASQESR